MELTQVDWNTEVRLGMDWVPESQTRQDLSVLPWSEIVVHEYGFLTCQNQNPDLPKLVNALIRDSFGKRFFGKDFFRVGSFG